MISYCSMIYHAKKGTLSIGDIKTPYDELDNDGPQVEKLTDEHVQEQLLASKKMWEEIDKKKLKHGQADH